MSENSRRPLPRLLPAVAGVQRTLPVGPRRHQPKRQRVSAACEPCRLRKTKCDGKRPTCGECTAREVFCRYVETQTRQLKQKYERLQKRQSAHEELFHLIRTMPEEDAIEVFRRIRAGGDIGAILNHVKDGNLLMQFSLTPEIRRQYDFA